MLPYGGLITAESILVGMNSAKCGDRDYSALHYWLARHHRDQQHETLMPCISVWWGYHFGRCGLMVSLKGINLFLQWCPKDLSTYAEISNVCTPELWAEWVHGKADFSFCNTVRQHIMTQGHLGYVCICSLLTVIENKLLQPRTRDMGDNKPGGIVAAASMFISKCICAFSTEFSPWVKGL